MYGGMLQDVDVRMEVQGFRHEGPGTRESKRGTLSTSTLVVLVPKYGT